MGRPKKKKTHAHLFADFRVGYPTETFRSFTVYIDDTKTDKQIDMHIFYGQSPLEAINHLAEFISKKGLESVDGLEVDGGVGMLASNYFEMGDEETAFKILDTFFPNIGEETKPDEKKEDEGGKDE